MYPADGPLWSYILEVEHPGDWTFKTKGSSLFIQELFSECYPQMDRLVEFFVSRSARRNDLQMLVRTIKLRHDTDRLVASQGRSNYFLENFVVFGIVGDFHTSIRRVIYKNEGRGAYLTVANGIERWHFYGTRSAMDDVLKDLPDGCKAQVKRTLPSPTFEPRVSRLMFNRGRMALLSKALARGYFDYPRGVSLTHLAADLGVTKSSLSQSLRSALKEVLTETLLPAMEEYV